MASSQGMQLYLEPGKRLPEIMRKQVTNHIYLGQWELAAATLRSMKKRGYPDVESLLETIISHSAGLSYGSETLPSPYHLSWLAQQLHSEITNEKSSKSQDVELNLLLYDLREQLSLGLIKKIQSLCQPWKDPYHTSSDLLIEIKPHLLHLLQTNIDAVTTLSTAFIQWCSDDIINELHVFYLDFIIDLLDSKSKEKETTVSGHEHDHFYRLLWLVAQFDFGDNEEKTKLLVSKLENLNQNSIFSTLLGIKGELTLRTYLTFLDGKRRKMDVMRTGKDKFWEELYLYCVKEKRHCLEVIMESALEMIEYDKFDDLSELLSLPWLRPLRPYLLLMGWKYCTSCTKAEKLIEVLHNEQEPCDVLISQACRKLVYQVNLVKWCLDRARPLVAASGTTADPDRAAAIFQCLDVNSPLFVLNQSTKLSCLDRDEVIGLLRKYPVGDDDRAVCKKVHFEEEESQMPPNDSINQDIATYRAFTALNQFVDALCHCIHLDAMMNSSNSQDEVQEFYTENVWNKICLGGKYLSELSLLTYRLEMMENVFTLLFVRTTDMTSYDDVQSDDVFTLAEGGSTETGCQSKDSGGIVLESDGFVASDYFVRDVLHVLKETLQQLDLELFKAREDSRKSESVTSDEMTSRLSRLRQYVSEASWRFSLVESSDCKPGHVVVSTNQRSADDSGHDDDLMEEIMERKKKNSPSPKRRISSSSKTSSGTPIRRSSQVLSPRHRSVLSKMLAPPGSLLNLCLRRGKFAQARTVITMLDLENSPEASEVDLAELHHTTSIQVQSLDRKSATFAPMTSHSSLSKPVANFVEEMFISDDRASAHAQALPLMALDLACTSCRTLESTINMAELARNRLSENETEDERLSTFLGAMIELLKQIEQISAPPLQKFRSSAVELLTKANLPLEVESCSKYVTTMTDVDFALTKVATILNEIRTAEKESFLNSMRGVKPEKRSDPRVLHDAMKQLIRVTSHDFSRTGVLSYFGVSSQDKELPFMNYLMGLYEHVKLLTAIMLDSEKEKKSKAIVVTNDYFKMLLDSPTAILGRLLFEKKMSPYRLEKYASKLKLDLVQIIVSSCCPEITSHVVPREEQNMNVQGTFVLNCGKCESTNEKRADEVVAGILTKVVQLMKAKVKSLHIGTSFTLPHAQSLLDDGDVIDILNQSRELRQCDVTRLKSFNERCSFYCNLANLLNIHTKLHCLRNRSDSYGLIHQLSMFGYQVGQLGVVSQLELRFLIMRSCLPDTNVYGGLLKQRVVRLDKEDHWYKLAPPAEPRLVFTLVDGFLGSPSLRVLTTQLVEQQLQQSMSDYFEHSVHVNEEMIKVTMSELLLWYRADFVGEENESYEDLLNFVAVHTTPEHREKLRAILDLDPIVPDSLNQTTEKVLPYRTSVHPYDYEFGYTFEYSPNVKVHRRISSLPIDWETLDKTVSRTSLMTSSTSLTSSTSQKTYNMRTVTLEYVKNKDPLIATLVSLVCSDDLDDIEEGFTDDFYNDSTKTGGTPSGRGSNRHHQSNSDISLVDVRSYRYQRLQTDFPRLKAYLMQNVIPLVGSDIVQSADPILKFVSNPIEKHIREVILARQDSQEFINAIKKILDTLLKARKWVQIVHVVNNIPELVRDAFPIFDNFKDWALCSAALENTSDRNSWQYLLQMKSGTSFARIVLGSLERWSIDVSVHLLEVCITSRDLDDDVISVARKKLETMKVYRKIVQCATRLKENQSSDPVLAELIADWRSIIELTKSRPHDVLTPLLRCHEFTNARKWANVHDVTMELRMIIEENYIQHLLEKGEGKIVDAYLEYESFLTKDEDFCLAVSDRILGSCYREHVVLFVSRFLLTHLEHRLSPERREELHLMCMGAKALLEFPELQRSEYCHLMSRPLLLVEQLLMNMQVELVKKTLVIIHSSLDAARSEIRHFDVRCVHQLLVTYGTKALEFPVVGSAAGLDESFSTRSQSRMSQFPGDERCYSRMSQAPGDERCYSRMSQAPGDERCYSRMSQAPGDERCYSRMSQAPGGEERMERIRKRSSASMCDPGLNTTLPSLDGTAHSSNTTASSLPAFSRSPAQRGVLGGKVFVMPLSPVPKEDWIPDLSVTVCMCCSNERFSMFTRRHHCRRCGRVVCGGCSNKTTLILGQQQRTCRDCHSQTFVSGTSQAEQSLHTRIMRKISGVTSVTSSTDSDGSPPEDGQTDGVAYVNYVPLEFTWKLGLDEEMNDATREDFYYEHSPSTSLCFSIMELHGEPAECGKQMLLFCDDLSRLLKTVVPGGATQEVDYNLVIGMMKYLLFNAKLKFLSCNDTSGIARCDQYLSRVDLMNILVANNCYGIPSIDELTKLDTVRRLRDKLIEEERLPLAMEVSTKCGLDTTGVWSAWGTACLNVNNLQKARTMFSRCMKPPVDKNQTNANKLLNEIVDTIENFNFQLNFRLPMPSGPELDEERFNECLYYLKTYGSHLALVGFYRRHGYWQKAAKYILDKKCSHEVFIEGLLVPALRTGEFALLEDQLLIIDPSLDQWHSCLTAGCRYLQKSRYHNLLYDMQVFMKDFIRAAMSCINFYYLRNARTYADLLSRVQYLMTARQHLETYLHHDQGLGTTQTSLVRSHSPSPDWAVRSPLADRAEKMPIQAVHKHIRTIMLQIEVTRLLSELNDLATSDVTGSEESGNGREGATGGDLPARRLATLFGNSKERSEVAVLVIEAAPDTEQHFNIGCRIITEYKLSASFVFSQVGRRLAKLSLFTMIRHFLSHVTDSGLCDDQSHDEIVGACVRIVADRPEEAKETESLIKQIKLDSNKINAYILCGKLKQAYLIAVKRGSIEDVQMIAGAATRSGQTAVRDICDRFLAQKQQNN